MSHGVCAFSMVYTVLNSGYSDRDVYIVVPWVRRPVMCKLSQEVYDLIPSSSPPIYSMQSQDIIS